MFNHILERPTTETEIYNKREQKVDYFYNSSVLANKLNPNYQRKTRTAGSDFSARF